MQKFRVRENSEDSPVNDNLIEYQAQILTKTQIEKLTNTSFPRSPHETFWGFIGIDPVLSAPKPETTDLQTAHIDGAVQDDLGNWVENWVAGDKFKDYTDENGKTVTKAEQDAAHLAKILSDAQDRMTGEVSRHHDIRKLSPVTVSIQGADYSFKGGLDSEGAIAKQEELSADLGLPTIKLWGIGEKSVDATYEESKAVRRAIGLQYAQHYDEQKTAIKNIKSAATVADAQAALDAYLALS